MATRVKIRGFVRHHVASVRTATFLACTTVVMIGSASVAITHTDPLKFPSIFDGLWWAASTITTVGYGDVVPASSEGRAIGLLLMFSGIALLAILTASIAALLMSEDVEEEERRIEHRLDAIEARLDAVLRSQPPHVHNGLESGKDTSS